MVVKQNTLSRLANCLLLSFSASISYHASAADIDGTTAADTIIGTLSNDTISARAGNDIIDGGLGDDLIYGDRGNDTITGNEGDDQIYGGLGDDTLDGGFGDDRLIGGDGTDTYIVAPLAQATTDSRANFQLIVENENSTPSAEFDQDVLQLNVDLGIEGAKVIFWGLTIGPQNLEIDYYQDANNTGEDDPQYLEAKITGWWANQQFPYFYGDPLEGIDVFRVIIDSVSYDVPSLNLFCLLNNLGSNGQSGRLISGDVLADYWSGALAMPAWCVSYPVTLTQS